MALSPFPLLETQNLKLETRNSDSIAIRCEGLSKQYRIGERESYKALRDVITEAATAPFRRMRSVLDGRRGTGDRTNGHPSPVTGEPSVAGSAVCFPLCHSQSEILVLHFVYE